MKVHLIKAKTVRKYAEQHTSSVKPFKAWINKVQNADWDIPQDMQQTFAAADLLGSGSNRVIFDVGGNNYRIICSYYFNKQVDTVTLFVKWAGSHAEYDKLCDKGRQYTVDEY